MTTQPIFKLCIKNAQPGIAVCFLKVRRQSINLITNFPESFLHLLLKRNKKTLLFIEKFLPDA